MSSQWEQSLDSSLFGIHTIQENSQDLMGPIEFEPLTSIPLMGTPVVTGYSTRPCVTIHVQYTSIYPITYSLINPSITKFENLGIQSTRHLA